MVLRLLFLALLFVSVGKNALSAELKDADARDDKTMFVRLTAFDNFPISQITSKELITVFDPFLSKLGQKHKIKFQYDEAKENINAKMAKTRTGKTDLIVGIYQLTKDHQGLEIIYPSILSNPIKFITLNNSNIKIQSAEDLKALKFGFNTEEIVSDFVKQQIKNLNAQEYTSDEDLYKDLFERKIDAIISSYYRAVITTAKMGLRKKVSFSSNAIWNMPLFFGISKLFPQRKFLREILINESSLPENKTLIEENLKNIVREFEIQHQGAVPPAYFVD